MMTNDSMSYAAIFAYLGIKIAQQYDFVVFLSPQEGGMQRVIKTIFHIIRLVKSWRTDTHKGGKAVFSIL